MNTQHDERSTRHLGRRERKKLDVLQRIREAAAALFHEKGYEATTVEEIAERADVAKGTFFNYFPRKDALLAALAEDMLDQLLGVLGPVATWKGTAQEQLLRFYLEIGAFVGRDPELSKMMLIENMRNFWLRTEEEPVEQAIRELTRSVLAAARERGELREDTDIEVTAKLLEAVFHVTTVDWLKAGTPQGMLRAQLAAQFDIVFRGLGARAEPEQGREA